jgi:hypothetical protein
MKVKEKCPLQTCFLLHATSKSWSERTLKKNFIDLELDSILPFQMALQQSIFSKLTRLAALNQSHYYYFQSQRYNNDTFSATNIIIRDRQKSKRVS